ncbi:hypothetical protein Tco_0551722 [Tanacetum coccineum]
MGDGILSVLWKIIPNLAMRATGTPLNSPKGTMCMIHLHMGGSYYSFPCSIISPEKDRKTPQCYPDVPITSRRISLRSMDSFQGLTPKTPSSWKRLLASNSIFYSCILSSQGSRPTPKPSSTHTPQAYVDAIYSNPHTRNQNEPTKEKSFTFHERTGTNPQPQALGTTFEARVRDYMAAHTKRIERFENAISKQREEINDRMAEMCGLHRKLTTSRAPEKVLIRKEAKYPVTKNVNSVSLSPEERKKRVTKMT